MTGAARERLPLRLMTCGSVDDGKSTLIGRLLHDTGSLPSDQLAVLKASGTDGRPDFASLVDGLEAEREQGITIDVAYRHMATARRRFLIADTPGHEQYTRNMATAASEAEVALLLVDARKGLLVQTRRHATIAALLGVRHVVLAVNKMDLVAHNQAVFEAIEEAFSALARDLGLLAVDAVPVSAADGDNLVAQSPAMPWYDGPTLLSILEDAAVEAPERPFRFPVQWVNRPTQDFRGLAGTIAGGTLTVGDEIVNARTGERAPVARILRLDGDGESATAGDAVTLVLDREIDVSRGDLLARPDERPQLADQLAADIVWMSREPLIPGRRYLIKISHRTIPATVTELRYLLDVETGEHLAGKTLGLNEIGRCNLSLREPVAFDPYDENRRTGAFVLIDPFTRGTVGAGLARFALRRAENVHWQALSVDRTARAQLLHQQPKLIWFTGLSGAGKSTIADIVEKKLHALGRHTYILDGDNVRHGLNRDLGFTDADRVENIRRVIEVARLMVDAGLIVIASFISPFRAERRMARDLAGADFVEVFVEAPLSVAEARDPKGLYAKARAGKLANFTGIDSPYEPPEAAEIVLDTTAESAEALADRVVAHLLAGER